MAASQISRSDGRELRANPGFVLEHNAAIAWDNAVDAFGKGVLLTGAWRSYETQERLFLDRYRKGYHTGSGWANDHRRWRGEWWTRRSGTAAAAVPGTSNHGGGVAVDVKTSRSAGDPGRDTAVVFWSWDDKDRQRFLRVAKEFGWADDEGRRVNEVWHLTYYPERDQHRGKIISTNNTEDGFTMTSKSEFKDAIVEALKSGEGREAVAQAFTIDGVLRAPSDTDPDNAYWTLEGYLRSIRSTAQRAEARAEEAEAAAKASKSESEALARDIAELRDALAAHDQKG